MNSQVCVSVLFTVLAILLNTVVVDAKEGYKGNWLHCDDTGIGFNLEKDVIGKAIACAAPHIMDIATIKEWNAAAIEKSKPELITKLVHCLLKKLGFIDDNTGKVEQTAPKELKSVFKQPNIQKQFMEVANKCYKNHEKEMSKEAKSFKGYIRCFENSKLENACPKYNIKPGNKFDASKFMAMG